MLPTPVRFLSTQKEYQRWGEFCHNRCFPFNRENGNAPCDHCASEGLKTVNGKGSFSREIRPIDSLFFDSRYPIFCAKSGYQEAMIKAELLAVCRQFCPKPEYELDRIAQAEGHHLLRTPQYHPELQPIEECWAVVKNHCAEKCDYTLQGLRAHLEEGFDKVTSETCRAVIADMQGEEDRYWREDMEESEE